jgi:hypothetical protein
MGYGWFALGLASALCLAVHPFAAFAQEVNGRVYVTSDICAPCHQDKFDLWKDTLHANVIRDARKNPELVLGDFSAEDLTFKREDVLYTVGSHWDQRYMTEIKGELYVLPKLWSVQSKQWRPCNLEEASRA